MLPTSRIGGVGDRTEISKKKNGDHRKGIYRTGGAFCRPHNSPLTAQVALHLYAPVDGAVDHLAALAEQDA